MNLGYFFSKDAVNFLLTLQKLDVTEILVGHNNHQVGLATAPALVLNVQVLKGGQRISKFL
jgi:hypothetical protein